MERQTENLIDKISKFKMQLILNKNLYAENIITLDIYENEIPKSLVHDFYRNFCQAIDGKAEQYIKNCQVKRVLEVMQAAFDSARTGRSIEVDI